MNLTTDQLKGAMIDMARRRFYYYCRFRLPRVYTKDRPHLERLCDALQAFWEGDRKRLILNMPPRFGKTLTVELLTEWILGEFKDLGVFVCCYNETLSSRFSKAVRGGISEIGNPSGRPVFSDYFPGVSIKQGDAAMQLWALEGSHFSFLATSPGGTATGIGAQLLIVDDLIKNAEEANNERILEEHWEWYVNTILSRLESGAKQIVIQTRWATNDLTGRLLAFEPEKWDVIKMPAMAEDGTMLCESILSKEEYLDREKKTDPVIFLGNYQQEPYDSMDKLYPELKTYQGAELPSGGSVEAYIDTADEGDDFLSGGVYRVFKNTAYVQDVLYTQEPMEVTEMKAAKMLVDARCQVAYIESNNGGKGFARNVERIMREVLNYTGCKVVWFHQSENKRARIITKSTNVSNSVIMPYGWKDRWPLLYQHLNSMSRLSKWKRDDCADFVTGIVEKSLGKKDQVQLSQPIPTVSRW